MTINSHGNDGLVLDSPSDGENCSNVFTLNVGALTSKGSVASFSNHGSCGDVYILGESVVVSAPENFLFESDGTSFSAPLFVRYLTQTNTVQSDYKDLYKKYKGSNSFISLEEIPRELAFDNSDPIGRYALTGKGFTVDMPIRKLKLPFGLK